MSIDFATTIGGKNDDYLTSLHVDERNQALLAGYTKSQDFPLQKPKKSTLEGDTDFFLSRLSTSGKTLLFSTYLGGDGQESGAEALTDNAQNIFLAGQSSSTQLASQYLAVQNKPFATATKPIISRISHSSSTTVSDNTWQLISLPYTAPRNHRLKDIVADDISATYGENWVMMAYDSSTGDYKKLSLSDPLQQGAAYLIWQNTGKTVVIDMPEGSYSLASNKASWCPPESRCFALPLKARGEDLQLHLVGNPFPRPLAWGKIKLITNSPPCSADSGGCNLYQASNAGFMESLGFTTHNGKTVDLAGGDYVQPWQGFWVRSFAKLAEEESAQLVFIQ